MSRKVILPIFTILTTLSAANCGLMDIFNMSSDYNLASALDVMFALTRNDIGMVLSGEITTPIEEDVTFWCGNRKSPELIQTFLDDSDIQQKIDFSKPIMLITHGWLDNHALIWIQDTAQDAMNFIDTNVCIVGWDQLSKYNYFQAAKENTRLVSDYLTLFVKFLNEQGMSLDNVTLVGHSLGGQICGQVGNNFEGKIAEIYGVDPAGPLFTFPIDIGLENRLDKADAQYVQVVLTSRNTLGVGKGDGHENFYPNGGNVPQPNCIFPVTSDAEMADQIVCSHMHATSLFRLSLDPYLVFKGNQCNNWISFNLKACSRNPSDLLGVYNHKLPGDFYLRTLARSPFAKV